MNTAATTGTSAMSLKSRISSSSPMPAQAPTQALRLSVTASAATSAGMTSAAQARSPVRKRMRAAAVQAIEHQLPE